MSRPNEPKRRDIAMRPPSPTALPSRARTAGLSAFPASTETSNGCAPPPVRRRAAQRLASQQHVDGPVRAKTETHATAPTEAPSSQGSSLQMARHASASAEFSTPTPPPPPPPPSLEALRRGSGSGSGVTRPPARGATHPARHPPSEPSPTAPPALVVTPTRSPPLDVPQSAEKSAPGSSEARSRIASLPRSSRRSPGGVAASPPATSEVLRHSTHFHADASVGGHASVAPSGSTNSRGSVQSLHHDTPSSIILSRHRPRIAAAAAAAALPTEQLLADGYYFASDDSVNSSFSDTPRSARRMSLGSSSSIRTPVQPLDLNNGGGGAIAGMRLAGRGAVAPSLLGAAQRIVPVYTHDISSSEGSADISFPLEGEDDDDEDALGYDEEDEEQAVLSYMDSAPESSLVARAGVLPATRAAAAPITSPLSASPPLPRHVAAHASAVPDASNGFCSDHGDFTVGENPPNRASDGPTPPLRCHAASSPHNSARSACERRTSPPRRLPNSDRKTTARGPVSGHASGTTAPTCLSRQHSTLGPAAPRRHSPVQPGGENTTPAHPPSAALPPPLSKEEEVRERQCKLLSLHEAFFANQSRSVWLVDDHVLAKVLEYVRIMGYEHPALRRDRAKGQASLWSSSSAVASPIALGRPKKRTPTVPKDMCRRSPLGVHASQSAAADAVAEALAQPPSVDPPTALHGVGVSGSAPTSPSLGAAAAAAGAKQFHLKSGRPRCAGQFVNTSTSTGTAHLFLTFSEAMRWIAEQEYVIGTVLLCCARFVGDAESDAAAVLGDDSAAWHPRRAMLHHGKPCIPLRSHPIHFVASLVCSRYPHWGGMATFAQVWETQVRLVLGSAAPPHQRLFKCVDDGLLISSDCEAGNLHRVERAAEPYFFHIWLDPDQGSDKRIWFRFAVTGAKEGRTLRFRLMNAAPHTKLYRQNGMMPVWRDGLSQPNWGPVDNCTFRTTNRDLDGEVCFSIGVRNSTETIQIAFCAPYSYADLLCHLCHWHALVKRSGCDMRFEERVLCRSPEGRKLHLLIITSRGTGAPSGLPPPPSSPSLEHNGAVSSSSTAPSGKRPTGATFTAVAPLSSAASSTVPGSSPTPSVAPVKSKTSAGGGAAAASAAAKEAMRGPYANFGSGKKVVLVSGRVHPGEVTASHGVHGLISFLLSSDVRAIQLREHFIFFIVPMLNPDGVSRGHSRMDQYGNNLNRCYNNPDPETQPTVLALRHVFEHLQQAYRERFIMYLDFHSHASQSSGFIFGNNLPARVQHWNIFFPRLVELHARQVFSFGLCRFGRVHMTTKDGASRVLFGGSLIHSYTVELTHFTDRRMYADDFVAMNNGSGVLFEATWPPMPTAGASSSGAGGEADGAGGGSAADCRAFAGPASRSRAATPTAGARGATATPLQRRSTSVLVGRGGRAHRSNSEGTGARGGGSAAARASAVAPARQRAGTAGEHRGASSPLVGGAAAPPPKLQPIAVPSILCQSAEVGRACLLALRDYCAIGARPSAELVMFGGMERVLRDVKRQIKSDTSHKNVKSQSAATYAGLHPIYKQY